MPREIELKLGLPPAAAGEVRAHPLLQGAASQQRLVSTYYDTPDLALHRSGIALRVREVDGRLVQTVKCAGVVASGLSDRPEWEQPWFGVFEFSAVDDRSAAALLNAAAPRLTPVFTTEFERELRTFADGEVTIRAMLDQGVICAGGLEEPLCELELELDVGEPRDLYRLALRLSETLPLWPEDRSKAERGYRLGRGAERAGGGQDPSLSVHLPAGIAFARLVGGEVRAWQRAQRLATEDPVEGVHQVRVTMRRLRSLLQLFAPVLGKDFPAVWRRRLGDNARRLGTARDLDVLCDELLPRLIGDLGSGDWPRVFPVLEAERGAARASAEATLAPEVQGRLMLEWMAAVTELPGTDDDIDLGTLAAQRMDRLRKGLGKRAARLPATDAARWHALRIAAKRLRYGLDFLAPLWPAKAVGKCRRQLARIQKRLGRVQDVEAAGAKLAELAAEQVECAALQRQLEHHYQRPVRRWRKKALREARELLAAKPPWQRTRPHPSRPG
jgi:adenylate cyclase